MAVDPAAIAQDILTYFTSNEFLEPAGRVVVWLKTFAIVASLILLVNIVLLAVKLKFYKNFYVNAMKGSAQVSIPEGKLKKRWKKVRKNVASRDPAAYKLALIDADKIVDHILDMGGYSGKTMDERLEKINDGQIENVAALSEVHAIVKKIVEDPQFIVSAGEAKEAIEVYESTLKDLDTDII